MSRPRTAHASSDCSSCGSRIRPGDLIVPPDDDLLDDGWQHMSCSSSLAFGEDAPVCPRCFMTVCDC